jgi:hypothetical protein
MTQMSEPPPGEALTTWLQQPAQAELPAWHRLIPQTVTPRATVAAAAAGFLGQLLFFGQLPGINFVIWVAAVLVAAVATRPPDARIDRLDLWLPLAALAFALFIALRDDAPLMLFDALAAGSLTLAAVVAIGGRSVSRIGFGEVVRLGGTAVLVAWFGSTRLASGLRPLGAALRPGSSSTLVRVMRGLLIALPLLLLFIALFAAADAVFEAYVQGIVTANLDWSQLGGRLILGALAGWLFAGTLTCTWLVARHVPVADEAAQAGRPLGGLEALVVLVVLDVVFTLFVLLQAAYLFGGADTLAVSGMTYSEYARRGFFELIAVALLSGSVIVGLDALVRERTRAYRSAAVVLAALTGVVLVSALVRLGLYQAAYGWTELRFYALAAIGWLAVGVITSIAALAANRVSLVWRVMVGAAVAIALLCNAIGPQSFVTGQNVARAIDPSLIASGGESGLDVAYIGSLGADSLPVLVDSYARLPATDQAAVAELLTARAGDLRDLLERHGWPSWNLARAAALDTVMSAGY